MIGLDIQAPCCPPSSLRTQTAGQSPSSLSPLATGLSINLLPTSRPCSDAALQMSPCLWGLTVSLSYSHLQASNLIPQKFPPFLLMSRLQAFVGALSPLVRLLPTASPVLVLPGPQSWVPAPPSPSPTGCSLLYLSSLYLFLLGLFLLPGHPGVPPLRTSTSSAGIADSGWLCGPTSWL